MKTIALRRLAELNPPTPQFDALPSDASVTFLPLEAVWGDSRADTTRRVSKAEVASGYTRFAAGDVVCPKVTPTFQAGRSMLAPAVGAGTTELHVLRARAGVDPRWLRYAVRSKHFLEEGVTAFQGVAGLQRVPPEFVQDFRIADLDLEEQRRIADFLDDRVTRIDQIIAARTKQVALVEATHLERLRRLTTQGLGTASQPTGIPWMPSMGANHRLWRVGQAFITGSGTTPRSDRQEYYDGAIPWATTSDLRDSKAVQPPRSVTRKALLEHSALTIYPAGTLLVAMYGATAGRAGILRVAATVNQACCALQPRGEVDPTYAFYWLIAHRPQVMRLASGGGQPNISQDIVRSLRIPVPGASEQRAVIDRLDESLTALERAQATLGRSVNLLREYKHSLITAAVTGELDVSTAGSGVLG